MDQKVCRIFNTYKIPQYINIEVQIFQHTRVTKDGAKESVNSEVTEIEARMFTCAASYIFSCVSDGCLSMQDMEIEQRPYHRNNCALQALAQLGFLKKRYFSLSNSYGEIVLCPWQLPVAYQQRIN